MRRLRPRAPEMSTMSSPVFGDEFICLVCGTKLARGDEEYRCDRCGRFYRKRGGYYDFIDTDLSLARRSEKEPARALLHSVLRRIGPLKRAVQSFFRWCRSLEFSVNATEGERLVNRTLPFLRREHRIIEVGCAGGRNVLSLSAAGFRIVGCDIQEYPESWSMCPERFFLASLFHLPFEDDSFDVVVSHAVLEHVENDIEALRELKRVCRPGGRLSIIVPQFTFYNRWSHRCKDLTHYREYSLEAILGLAEECELQLEHYSASGFVAPLFVRTIHFWLNFLPLLLRRGMDGSVAWMEFLGRMLPARERAVHQLILTKR